MTDHLPCPCGTSSDAFSLYDNGWGTCFSGNCECERWSPRKLEEAGYDPGKKAGWKNEVDEFYVEGTGPSKVNSGNIASDDVHSGSDRRDMSRNVDPIRTIFDRGINRATIDKYKVRHYDDRDEFDISTPQGEPLSVKTRTYPKTFRVDGSLKGAGLFGRNAFPAGSAKAITVTEGYEDALAVYQLTGSKYPSVSIHGSASAVADIRNDFEYLNSFDTVVLCFDNDEAGHKAAEKVCEYIPFPIGKVKVLWLAKDKDASAYLEHGYDFEREWWKADTHRPDGLVFGKDMLDELLREDEYFMVDYPFPGLNHKTYGMRTSELTIIHAPPKIGKTSFIKHIEHKLLTDEKVLEKGYGVGFLHFEEPKKETAMGLISIENGVPYHLPDVPKPEADIKEAFHKILDNTRVILYDHFGSNRIDVVLNKVRHMAVMGCKYIVIDHLSIIVSDQSGDERKQLDEIITKLKTMTMELELCVIAVIHENREGSIRGTMAAEQLANIVIALSRDKMDNDPWRANVTKVDVTDNRFCGRCGTACYLYYDEATTRMTQLGDEDAATFESGSSRSGGV